MADVRNIAPYLEPLRRTAVVRRKPEEAFDIFTARIATWWPYTQYSIHQEETVSCAIEPRVGGQVYETSKSGERGIWGTVLAWDPPRRFVMTWHPGHEADTAQEVEVRFVAVPEGTRVELEHRGWEKLGAGAEEARSNYNGGWAHVFDVAYVGACQ
jgi:uncharacterized protein YndB with AHSA1/START domain